MTIKRIKADWPELDPNRRYDHDKVLIHRDDYALARSCIHALRGLPVDALGGGWCYSGINNVMMTMEASLASAKAEQKRYQDEVVHLIARNRAQAEEIDRMRLDIIALKAGNEVMRGKP